MDVYQGSLLVGVATGVIGVALHNLGYLPRPYRARLEATERRLAELPHQMGLEVENALNRVAAQQEAKYEAAAKEAEKDVVALKRAGMSMVRSVGVDAQAQAKISTALSEAILGPALPILRQFAPGLADTLEANPQLVDVVLQNPLFKKYIEPRIQQFLGSQQSAHLATDGSGWGP